jgi:inner membrane protein
MSPITHFLAGWTVANSAKVTKRDRMLIALAGVLPDIDGIGVVIDLFTRNKDNPFEYYQRYHHVFGHNLLFSIVATIAAFILAVQKRTTAVLVLLSIHLHFLCDIVGSRGSGDDFWAVPYFWPFTSRGYYWTGQWPLNGWQNFLITGILLAFTFYWSWKRGYSPLEMVSAKMDRGVVQALRNRFGNPSQASVSASG